MVREKVIKGLIYNNILNGKPTESITLAAFIIFLAGVASRILGLFRDRILASQFGAGDTLDIYYTAFRIPDMVYNLLVLGALSAAFIPVFTGLQSTQKENEGWRLASGMLNLQTIAVFLISGIFALFSPWLLRLIAPGFPLEKIMETASFSRIMFFSPVLLGISAIFGGILISFKKFLIYSLAPIFYNIGIIIGALFFVPSIGTIGLAWGVVLGAFLHMLTQYPAVRFSGFKYFLIDFSVLKNENIRQVIRLMIPRALSIAVNQVNLLVVTVFASTLAAGSLTVFTLAHNIQMTPVSLFGSSFAVAVFPVLSSLAARHMNEKFSQNFEKTARQILFFVLPLSAVLLILRAQIVRVVLGSGNFGWEDTVLTFEVLGILTFGLAAQALAPLLTRSFYAMQNTKTPFYIALASEIVNISLVILLIKKYAIYGIAAAFVVAGVINTVLLFIFLRKRYLRDGQKSLFQWIAKIIFITAIMCLFVQMTKYGADKIFNLNTFIGIFSQLVFSLMVGFGVFVFFCHWFKIEEYSHFKNSLLRRMWPVDKRSVENIKEMEGL